MRHPNTRAVYRKSYFMDFPGYVVAEDCLNQIDSISSTAVTPSHDDDDDTDDGPPRPTLTSYAATFTASSRIVFTSLESLLDHARKQPDELRELNLRYLCQNEAGINLAFRRNGRIELSAYSREIDFQFHLDRIRNELLALKPDYALPIRMFVFSPWARRLAFASASLLSMVVFCLLAYFLLAKQIGVNVDPKLLTPGMGFAQDIERAIKSPDLENKLNTLLRTQLRGFSNVSDVFIRVRAQLFYATFFLCLSFIIIFILRRLRFLYPRAFFAVGRHVKSLEKLERRRDIWNLVIVVGLLVNLAAGILLALFV
jgi:hypothetical protein